MSYKWVQFQSPIGTNKTRRYIWYKFSLQRVSIPYRYKQNFQVGRDIILIDKSQSPIGTNKTIEEYERMSHEVMSQSPIGTNKTE